MREPTVIINIIERCIIANKRAGSRSLRVRMWKQFVYLCAICCYSRQLEEQKGKLWASRFVEVVLQVRLERWL